MKERYVFLIGFGVGIVLTSLIGFFAYNLSINKMDLEENIKTTEEILENLNSESTNLFTEQTTEETTQITQTTTIIETE